MRLGSSVRQRLGPLRERPFRLLWIGQTTSAFGDALLPLAIAFAVLRLGGSAADLGLVLAAFSVPRLIFILAGGVWADRLPRQGVMVAADTIRGGTEAVLALLLLAGAGQLWQLPLAAAVIGTASAFFMPASSGILPQIVSAAQLQQANALMSISRSTTMIIGPTVSGLIVAAAGAGPAFALDAATFGVSTVSLLLMRLPRRAPSTPRQPFITELAGGWHELVSRSWLRAAIVAFGVSNVCVAPFFVLGPVVANGQLGGAPAWGLIATAQGIGALSGGLIALRWRPGRPLAAVFALAPLSFLPLYALAPPLAVPLIMLAAAAAIASTELTNTWWFTVLQQQIPPAALSRVSSYDWLVSMTLQPVGYMLVGPVAEGVGTSATLVGAATLGIGANLAVLLVASLRRLNWAEESQQ